MRQEKLHALRVTRCPQSERLAVDHSQLGPPLTEAFDTSFALDGDGAACNAPRIGFMRHRFAFPLLAALVVTAPFRASAESATNEPLQKLSSDFWAWRAQYAPFSGDDVNRVERPGGMRDWSRAKIDSHRQELADFETRWKQLEANDRPVSNRSITG